MPTGPTLPDQLRPLARLFDEPKPNVLLVVGTGISIGATRDPRASWKGLLLDALNRIEALGISKPNVLQADRTLIEEAFTGKFDLDEILQRAESVVKRLGGAEDLRFADWLKDSVGSLKAGPDRRQSLDAIADLEKTGAVILTTNYDGLLTEVTGLDPVTWEEPNRILEILNRQRKGIIHIHGHWSRPSSVVLGRTSYEGVKAAALPQTELKSLWLHWHWLYLGCGSGGLDDPNLGTLLQWAHDAGFGESALRDFFFSTQETIDTLPNRLGKSANLARIAYSDHATDLPILLQGLVPLARPSPFQRIGPDARRLRRDADSPLQTPFPSWREYLDGSVPSLAADQEVIRRLTEHSWAFILDVASVGKSTLAYRIATTQEYRSMPVYYLLLSKLTVGELESDISPQAALARLARPGVLFIIDDCHQRPELAHMLWQQWRERPMGSKLILLATRMEKPVYLPGETSLHDLEVFATNPAVALRPSPENLECIANYVLARIDDAATNLNPQQETLRAWHKAFGREIGAFVVAVSQRRHELLRGNLTLPESAAATWIKERHLTNLGLPDIENAVCLAVFGEQDLELDVPEECLPHPLYVATLLKSGLVERTSVGAGRFVRYGLREPGWGRLILAAVEFPLNPLCIMADGAAKNIITATAVSSRLHLTGDAEKFTTFWQLLAKNVHSIVGHALRMPLAALANFCNAAVQAQQQAVAGAVWSNLAMHADELVDRALKTSLDVVAWFIEAAIDHNQKGLVDSLWQGLRTHPKQLADQAFNTQLHFLAAFLSKATTQDENELVRDIWHALTSEPARVLERAYAGSSNDFSAFLLAAADTKHNELIAELWRTISTEPDRFIDWILSGSVGDINSFLGTAFTHGSPEMIGRVWTSLRAQPKRLAERALETPLNEVSGFFVTAKEQGQTKLVEAVWHELAAHPEELAERISKQPPNFVMSLLVHMPKALKTSVVSQIKKEDWTFGVERNKRFSTGASGLAGQFGQCGRDDLKAVLIDTILRRKNRADFDDARSALTEISRLVSFATPDQQHALID